MNRTESNETIMKQFEIMINTADEALSQQLISVKNNDKRFAIFISKRRQCCRNFHPIKAWIRTLFGRILQNNLAYSVEKCSS